MRHASLSRLLKHWINHQGFLPWRIIFGILGNLQQHKIFCWIGQVCIESNQPFKWTSASQVISAEPILMQPPGISANKWSSTIPIWIYRVNMCWVMHGSGCSYHWQVPAFWKSKKSINPIFYRLAQHYAWFMYWRSASTVTSDLSLSNLCRFCDELFVVWSCFPYVNVTAMRAQILILKNQKPYGELFWIIFFIITIFWLKGSLITHGKVSLACQFVWQRLFTPRPAVASMNRCDIL